MKAIDLLKSAIEKARLSKKILPKDIGSKKPSLPPINKVEEPEREPDDKMALPPAGRFRRKKLIKAAVDWSQAAKNDKKKVTNS